MSRVLVACGVVATVWVASARIDAQSQAPSSLSAAVSGQSVTLTWQAPAGTITTYVLEVGSARGLVDLLNTPTGSASTTLSVGGVPFGTYFVRVRAFSPTTGLSAPSNEITVVVVPCVLPSPANLMAFVISRTVSLAWSSVAGAQSFQLEAGSAPSLANLVNVDVGATQALQVSAPTGTYHVRVRAKAPSCGTSAPSPDTVVRVGTAAGIGFSGATNGPFTTYTEGGFTVDALTGPWTVQGPFIQFTRAAGAPTSTGEIRVTAGGLPFRFTSVGLYSSVTPIPFVITGLLNSTAVFTMTGTVPNTFGTFAAVSAATGHLAIDTLLISIDNPATPSCPSCVNPVGIDNIAVSF